MYNITPEKKTINAIEMCYKAFSLKFGQYSIKFICSYKLLSFRKIRNFLMYGTLKMYIFTGKKCTWHMLRQVNIMYIFSWNFLNFFIVLNSVRQFFLQICSKWQTFEIIFLHGYILLHVLAIFKNLTKITPIWLNKVHESYTSYQAIQTSYYIWLCILFSIFGWMWPCRLNQVHC